MTTAGPCPVHWGPEMYNFVAARRKAAAGTTSGRRLQEEKYVVNSHIGEKPVGKLTTDHGFREPDIRLSSNAKRPSYPSAIGPYVRLSTYPNATRAAPLRGVVLFQHIHRSATPPVSYVPKG